MNLKNNSFIEDQIVQTEEENKKLVSIIDRNMEVPDDLNIGQFANRLKVPIPMLVATDDEMNGANPNVTQFVYDNITQSIIKFFRKIDKNYFLKTRLPDGR